MKITMNRASKIALIAGIIFAVFIVGTAYVIINDWPWNRAVAEQGAQIYLEHKYAQKMVIDKSQTVFENIDGIPDCKYLFTAYPANERNLIFYVYQMTTTPEYTDDYCEVTLAKNMETDLDTYVHRIYSDQDNTEILINNDSMPSDENWNFTSVPSYIQAKDQITQMNITINITKPFDLSNPDAEYQRMLDAVKSIKELGYQGVQLQFCYDKTDNINTETDIDFSLNLNNLDLSEINMVDDIKNAIVPGDLYKSSWNDEIVKKLDPFVKSQFADGDAFTEMDYNEPAINNLTMPNIPDYKQAQSQGLITDLSIGIYMKSSFNSTNADQEYQKIFNIVQFIKQQNYGQNEIDFHFGDDLFHSFDFKAADLPSIYNSNDIKKYQGLS